MTQKYRGWRLKVLVLPILTLLLFSLFLSLDEGTAQAEVLKIRARRGADIVTMDPARYTGNEEYNLDLAIFSKLMQFEASSSQLLLDAVEWLEVSEDERVISFKLQEGIQFHQGFGELTADDVKFSFERIIDPEIQSEYASDWRTLERVEVTGKYSGEIILSEPFAPLFVSTIPYTSGSIVSRAAFETLGDRVTTNPVGSGPYYWAEWIPNQKIVLERFEDYYGKRPAFSRIEIYPIIDDKVAEMAFDRGDLDATEISLDSFERYKDDPQVDLHILTTLRYHWLGFNQEHPPFHDIRVREAVRYAVDVDAVLAAAYNNIPERANSMLPPDILGYWEDAPQYQVDLDRARDLLAQAGYPDGFSTQITTDPTPYHVDAAQIIQHQLNRIGIDARINVVEAGAGYETMGKGSPEGMHYQSFSAILDPGYWFEWFTTEQVGRWNYWKWSNEEYDMLHERAALTMDPEERAEIYVRMQEIIDEDITCLWITNGASIYVTRPDVDPAFLAQYSQYRYFHVK